MKSAEYHPEANVVPGEGDRIGDIMPPDEGVFDGTGRWPRIDKRLAYEEASYRAQTDDAHVEALMAEESEQQAADAAWDDAADRTGSYYLGGTPEQRKIIDQGARRARALAQATGSGFSAHVNDRTDHNVVQPLVPGVDDKQIAINREGLDRVRAALQK